VPRTADLGRTIILIMLGEDFVGDEQAILLEATLGDDSASFLE
jgi:hypothetical protein